MSSKVCPLVSYGFIINESIGRRIINPAIIQSTNILGSKANNKDAIKGPVTYDDRAAVFVIPTAVDLILVGKISPK